MQAVAVRGEPPERAAIELRRATLGHGRLRVLRSAVATAPQGAHLLLVGDNGSGKSTLIQTLAGLLPKQGGQVAVLGLDPLLERRTLHARIGHLGHRDPFYPELTGWENLVFHARLRGLSGEAVDARLLEVGLMGVAGRQLGGYSHGMRRRLGLAKALLGDPELVLLDEPESGLDAGGRAAFRTHLARRAGRTVLLSTHHWPDWLEWADQVWALGGGRLEAVELAGERPVREAAVEAVLSRLGGASP